MKPSHQWGALRARLGGGCCGVHVAEELFNLPQGDTPTSVTHLGEMRHVGDSPACFRPRHPQSSPGFPYPQGLPKPTSWQEGSASPLPPKVKGYIL